MPPVARGSLLLNLGHDRLRQEVVLVLRIVAALESQNGMLDDKVPTALLAKVDGFLGVGKRQRRSALVGIRVTDPAHQRVRPFLGSDAVLVEENLPAGFGVQRSLPRRLFLL